MSSRPCPGLTGGRMATAAILHVQSRTHSPPRLSGCARVRCSLVDLIIGQFFSTSNRAWCRPFAHGFPLPLPAPNFGGSNESGVLYGFTFVKIFHLVSQDLLLPFVKFLSLCFTYKLNPVCHFASPSRLLRPSSLLCWSVSV